jgi:hypothetical protein
MKIFENDRSIGFIDEDEPKIEKNKETYFFYEKEEIPNVLIDRCEDISKLTGDTYFIFDGKITTKIQTNFQERDKKLSYLIGEMDSELEKYKDTYHIGDETFFSELPSRFSYYDTETKLTCRYKKIDLVIAYLGKLGFTESQFNYGAEYEQSFYIEIRDDDNKFIEKFIVRLQPNLFLRIVHCEQDNTSIYNGFFNKQKIINSISKVSTVGYECIMRNAKLEKLLQ